MKPFLKNCGKKRKNRRAKPTQSIQNPIQRVNTEKYSNITIHGKALIPVQKFRYMQTTNCKDKEHLWGSEKDSILNIL